MAKMLAAAFFFGGSASLTGKVLGWVFGGDRASMAALSLLHGPCIDVTSGATS